MNILDASRRDTVSSKNMTAHGSATKMLTAPGQTLVLQSGSNTVTVIDNATEAATFTPSLIDLPSDVAITPMG